MWGARWPTRFETRDGGSHLGMHLGAQMADCGRGRGLRALHLAALIECEPRGRALCRDCVLCASFVVAHARPRGYVWPWGVRSLLYARQNRDGPTRKRRKSVTNKFSCADSTTFDVAR